MNIEMGGQNTGMWWDYHFSVMLSWGHIYIRHVRYFVCDHMDEQNTIILIVKKITYFPPTLTRLGEGGRDWQNRGLPA